MSIDQAHESTIEWAFEDEHAGRQLTLRDWLENGEGVFWVSSGISAALITKTRFNVV